MAPVRQKTRLSGQPPSSDAQQTTMTVPTKTGTPSRTPHNRSPIKKRKTGLTISQKQSLIGNLQLEITERARKLRAEYNLLAQSLRSRIEMRVNRIPSSLLKMTMGDLLVKYQQREQLKQQKQAALRAPPVPAKDALPRLSPQKSQTSLYASHKAGRGQKRTSDAISGLNKENEMGNIENPKKRTRNANVVASDSAQVLSPASSNSRLAPRERPASPTKSFIARPASPSKLASSQRSGTGLLSSTNKPPRAAAGTRKATTAPATAPSTVRGRKAAGATATGTTRTATARTTRRISGQSTTSTESTSTVVRKATRAPAGGARRPTAAATKRAVTGTAAKKATTTKSGTASASGTTRVLRKRA